MGLNSSQNLAVDLVVPLVLVGLYVYIFLSLLHIILFSIEKYRIVTKNQNVKGMQYSSQIYHIIPYSRKYAVL
jgi:hypothetical protein